MKTSKKHKAKIHPKVNEYTLPLRDSVKVIGVFASIFILILIAYVISCRNRHLAGIEHTIRQWQTAYGLTPAQTQQMKEIELSFHGTGSPFIPPSKPSKSELSDHYIELSNVMNGEQRKRFLNTFEQIRDRH